MNTATKYFLWVVAAEEESFLILILIISSVSSTQFRDLHIIADLVEFIHAEQIWFLITIMTSASIWVFILISFRAISLESRTKKLKNPEKLMTKFEDDFS